MNSQKKIKNFVLLNILPHVFKYYTFFDEVLIENNNKLKIFSNPKRFDLFAKYIYILYKDRNLQTKWGENLYKEHIKAFNNFFEDDNSNKTDADKFVSTFNNLLEIYRRGNINEHLSLIPLDENNCPLDGAHRLALSVYYDRDISTIRMKSLQPHNSYAFDYNFFIKKGFDLQYSDFIALEYAKLNPNTYLMCVFPNAEVSPRFEHILSEYAQVFYKKDVYLNQIGRLNTVLSLYKNEAWLGDFTNNFLGANYKTNACFPSSEYHLNQPLIVYLLVSESLEKIIQLKSQLRSLFDAGKHSLHINDFHEETTRLCSLFFNENSIDYINNVTLPKYDKFLSYFKLFKNFIKEKDLNIDNFCVSGSSVLSAFGLRDCYDLDFLASDEKNIPNFDNPMISCHNENFLRYSLDEDISIHDIIFDPKNHFYIDGVKFLSLKQLKKIKIIRNEEKDVNDVKLINKFYKNYSSHHDLKYPRKKHIDSKKNMTCFLESIEDLRTYVRIEWYNNITKDNRFIHPKIPTNLPEYFVDRYSYRVYLNTLFCKIKDVVFIPDYDIFAVYDNWYSWIMKNFSGLPNHNYPPPSLNAKIPKSNFRFLLFKQWREYIRSFGIKVDENYCKDPEGIYWFEYFQNSCLFPKRPAMWGPTYFYKLALKQQDFLITNYGLEGVMDFFVFMQQVHEESHINQKGEPLFCEFIHAWLWCDFLKINNLEIFQINNETMLSCNTERPWVTQCSFTKSEIKNFFMDTYTGSRVYFAYKITYENICLIAYLFDIKQINYAKYLDMMLDIFLNKHDYSWQNVLYQQLLFKIKIYFEKK